MYRLTILLWLISVGISMSTATDEFRSFVNEGELSMSDDGPLMGIIPGGYSPHASLRKGNIYNEDFLEYNEYYKIFKNYVKKGTTMKGLVFNIYNEDMKEAASSLFQLIHNAEIAGYNGEKLLNFNDFNDDLVTYAFHLNMLYRDKHLGKASFLPPFITNPNFFVNSETIMKALKLSNSVNFDIHNTDEAHIGQYYKMYDTIIINTNYSGWNLPHNGGEEELNYFREDISLNSYYYGVHLMHPYWMFGHKLYSINPRHDEHYYFIHQQLSSRLNLEKQHIIQENRTEEKPHYSNFNPYLIHENGLPFPTRSNFFGEWCDEKAKIKAIDIAIKECTSRGLIMINNSSPVKMTEENYVSLLTKLIRANFEVGSTAKIARSLFGYGRSGYSTNAYDPAPTLLHHPQTSLRDPIYWFIMQYVLTYFVGYEDSIDPFYLRQYESKQFQILDAEIPKITTYFDYYQFNINRAISKNDVSQVTITPFTVTARQKRLKHSKFEFNFTVDCYIATKGIVRLFLGPPCPNTCWDQYTNFFELDTFTYSFEQGLNIVTWSPETSNRFSNDDYYNMERFASKDRKNNYNMFKFPENLVIPRGSEKGLNLTLFIMITPPDDDEVFEDSIPLNNLYADINHVEDKKPLGFPFHRSARAYDEDAPNYKFYNITIYHKQNNSGKNGYFSPHLY